MGRKEKEFYGGAPQLDDLVNGSVTKKEIIFENTL